ncbi:molybdopterin synthase [Halobellus ruber]|uniref:Molybdopterin synthase n=1 Tax=Halobellus ruber TaxID=2761102 RepID=A0A7J9SJF2_9EURY|nr:molybdopterin synthase [Halobellus ruber]MBB6646848.1 molybdopterin synthase [Halobellus ruber]
MQVLGIAGPGARTLCDRVAPHLDGRVAVVDRSDGSQDGGPPEGVAAAYRLGDDGAWSAAGADRGLDDVLDDLAATYDHALLVGFPGADVPTVALGDADPERIALSADSEPEVETDAVLDAVADAEPYVTLETLVEQVKASPRAHRAGAIATFTGRVRAKDGEEDPRTLRLTFEKYEGVAEDRLRSLESELMERAGVEEVVMFHRTGTLEAGEDIVFVVVLAGHREEAFETVSDGIDRLKDEVPIFKRETTVEEDFWVHDRQ